MKKILVISYSSFRIVNRAIFRELSKYSYNIKIIVPEFITNSKGNAIPYEKEPLNDFYEIVPQRIIGKNARLWTFEHLIRSCDDFKPDIIYLENDPNSYMAFKLSQWAIKNKKKIICLSDDNLSRKFKDALIRGGFKGIFSNAVIRTFSGLNKSNIDHIFVLSNDGIWVLKTLGYQKLSKIPLGFDPQIFFSDEVSRNIIRAKLNLKSTTIGYFGRMIPQKGIHLIINALLKITDLEWELLINEFEAGRDNYQDSIYNLLKTNKIVDRIRFIKASHKEIADYMRATDIVVVPSITAGNFKEQFGRVISEAMACGNALIVSNCGALPEVVNNCGIVIKENSTKELALALGKLLTDSTLRRDLRGKAINRAKEELSVIKQAKIIADVFQRL